MLHCFSSTVFHLSQSKAGEVEQQTATAPSLFLIYMRWFNGIDISL